MAKDMRQTWEERAGEKAYWWVLTTDESKDKNTYYATGKKEIEHHVLPYLHGRDPKKMRALDIGCGTGRITRHLAGVFGEAVGIDISEEMLRQAREDNPGISFYHTDGSDLAAIKSDSVDFAFSRAVLQHIPDKKIVRGYFQEAYRVLNSGGLARLDIRSNPGGALGHPIWWTSLDTFYVGIFRWKFIPFPYIRRNDFLFGACFKEGELRKIFQEIGFKSVKLTRENYRSMWADLEK